MQTIESISTGAVCHQGLVRESNEDRCFFRMFVYTGELGQEQAMIAVVADGMGGHAAGEAASERATQVVASRFSGMSSRNLSRQASPDWPVVMREAFDQTNTEVFEESRRWTGRSGMGTTLTAAVIASDVMHFGHVGDSRIYLIRNGGIMRVTQDHTWVARRVREGRMTAREAETSERRGQLTEVIGLRDTVRPEIDSIGLRPGDVIVLCTDGLTEMISDAEILAVARAGFDAQRTAARLVAAANRAGGHDNIAVVVIRCHAVQARGKSLPPKQKRKRSRKVMLAFAVVMALILTDVVYILSRYAEGGSGRRSVTQSLPQHRPQDKSLPELGGAVVGDIESGRPILDMGGRPVEVEGR